jgi:hypothetical protein
MLLRHYLEHGTTKSAVARQLGISRDTIHRWIRAGDLDRDLDRKPVRYGPRAPAPTKLDPHKSIIEARLAAYPELSAVRLLDEIRAAGYGGSYTQLKAYVRRVRPVLGPEPVIRFETPAGRQAQVDFARFRWGVRYALLVVLGYSRLLWCRFYPRQDMATLIDGVEEAFLSGDSPQLLIHQWNETCERLLVSLLPRQQHARNLVRARRFRHGSCFRSLYQHVFFVPTAPALREALWRQFILEAAAVRQNAVRASWTGQTKLLVEAALARCKEGISPDVSVSRRS